MAELDFWNKDLSVQGDIAFEAADYFLDTLKRRLRRSRRGGGFDREKIEYLDVDDIGWGFDRFQFSLIYYDISESREHVIETFSFNFFYQEYYDIYGSRMEPIRHKYAPETEEELKEFITEKIDEDIDDLVRDYSYYLGMLKK